MIYLDEVKTELKGKLIYEIYSNKISINEESISNELEEIIKNNKNRRGKYQKLRLWLTSNLVKLIHQI